LGDPVFMQKIQMLQQNPQLMGSMFNDPDMQEVMSVALGVNMMSPDSFMGEVGRCLVVARGGGISSRDHDPHRSSVACG